LFRVVILHLLFPTEGCERRGGEVIKRQEGKTHRRLRLSQQDLLDALQISI
jgi:hypothetical protein